MCIRDSFPGGSGKDFQLVLGSGQMIPGFETGLVGATPGEERVLELSSVSYTHLRAHETVLDIVCRLLLEKKKIQQLNIHTMQAYWT